MDKFESPQQTQPDQLEELFDRFDFSLSRSRQRVLELTELVEQMTYEEKAEWMDKLDNREVELVILGLKPAAIMDNETTFFKKFVIDKPFQLGSFRVVGDMFFDEDAILTKINKYKEIFSDYIEGQDLGKYLLSFRSIAAPKTENDFQNNLKMGVILGYPVPAVRFYFERAQTKVPNEGFAVRVEGYGFTAKDEEERDSFQFAVSRLYMESGASVLLAGIRKDVKRYRVQRASTFLDYEFILDPTTQQSRWRTIEEFTTLAESPEEILDSSLKSLPDISQLDIDRVQSIINACDDILRSQRVTQNDELLADFLELRDSNIKDKAYFECVLDSPNILLRKKAHQWIDLQGQKNYFEKYGLMNFWPFTD